METPERFGTATDALEVGREDIKRSCMSQISDSRRVATLVRLFDELKEIKTGLR